MAVLGTGHEVVNKLPAETRGGTEPGSGQRTEWSGTASEGGDT
jgi:hypothetical protein